MSASDERLTEASIDDDGQTDLSLFKRIKIQKYSRWDAVLLTDEADDSLETPKRDEFRSREERDVVPDIPEALMTSAINEQIIRCDCGGVFTGDSKETNYMRHKRTSKKHNAAAVYQCFDPDCDAYFSRSDNYTAHFKTVHQQPKGAKSQPPFLVSIKRKRLATEDIGRESTMSEVLDGRLRISTQGLGLDVISS